MLHHTISHCNTLQHTAAHCKTLPYTYLLVAGAAEGLIGRDAVVKVERVVLHDVALVDGVFELAFAQE